MHKQHEKSPCCRRKVWHLGTKRRQCSQCRRTWSVWARKRGRPKRRDSTQWLCRYLGNRIASVQQEAQDRKQIPRTAQYRMQQVLARYVRTTPWPAVPNGPLIVIADAMIEFIQEQPHTVYFIFLRSVHGIQAVVTKPFIQKGREGQQHGWTQAFRQLPEDVLHRIVALICDGNQELLGVGHARGWQVQRCQFHLKARIRHNLSTSKFSRNYGRGQAILNQVEVVLHTSDVLQRRLALNYLRQMASSTNSRSLRTVLNGFMKHHADYVTYLQYPEYRLPHTSNTAESFIRLVRHLQQRARGFRTPASLALWIEAFCKYRKFIRCNPKTLQN